MKIHHIPVKRQARYYTLGTLDTNTKHVYIVLHGYGQLASQIIHKFDDMADEVFIIAPEGLSRFYWDGMTGTVGASWMTKEDRFMFWAFRKVVLPPCVGCCYADRRASTTLSYGAVTHHPS